MQLGAKPDLGPVKQRQQQAWVSGDFAVVSALTPEDTTS